MPPDDRARMLRQWFYCFLWCNSCPRGPTGTPVLSLMPWCCKLDNAMNRIIRLWHKFIPFKRTTDYTIFSSCIIWGHVSVRSNWGHFPVPGERIIKRCNRATCMIIQSWINFILFSAIIYYSFTDQIRLRGTFVNKKSSAAVATATATMGETLLNSLRPRPNRRHFADDIFKRIF